MKDRHKTSPELARNGQNQ